MGKLFAKLKKLLRIGTKKAVETLGDIVERLDWAEKEIKEVEDRLVELSHRLHDGIVELEGAAKSSEAIIKRHQEILEKAKNRKCEFEAKSQVVSDLIESVNKDVK